MLTVPLATLLLLVSLSVETELPSVLVEQAPAARAQSTGAVSATAPVFLLPDATRTPLRTLPAGTIVRIGEVRGDWVQITFNDGVLGQRTGWMERKFITFGPVIEADPAQKTEPTIPPATQPRPRVPPRPVRQPIGVRAFGSLMIDKMAASESFNAIIGKDSIVSYGGGLQVTNLWRGLFVEGSYDWSSEDGERVFVLDDEVFPLGIPLTLEMANIDIVGGWRQDVGYQLHAYGGAGATLLQYKETSDFANDAENIDERYTGFVVMGGIEAALTKWIHARGEVRYRKVSDVLGIGGVSEAFDESTLGGFGFGVKVAIGR